MTVRAANEARVHYDRHEKPSVTRVPALSDCERAQVWDTWDHVMNCPTVTNQHGCSGVMASRKTSLDHALNSSAGPS